MQYTPPSAITCLAAANNILFLAAAPLSIIIIDLNNPEDLVTVELPKPAAEKGAPTTQRDSPSISQLFVDPSARHLLITTTSGDTFYSALSPGNSAVQSRRPRPLRLRQAITAVAWSPVSSNEATDQSTPKTDASTPPSIDVLLGTANGQIMSLPLPPQDDIFKSVSIGMSKPAEKDLQTVYTLSEGQAVTGVAFGFWPTPSGAKKGEKRGWVIFTTRNRLYEVQGNVTIGRGAKAGAWAEEVFKPVREGSPSAFFIIAYLGSLTSARIPRIAGRDSTQSIAPVLHYSRGQDRPATSVSLLSRVDDW